MQKKAKRKTNRTAPAEAIRGGAAKRSKPATERTKKRTPPKSRRVLPARTRAKPGLRKSDGFSAELALVEQLGGKTDKCDQKLVISVATNSKTGGGATLRRAAGGLIKAVPALAAAAHEHRVKVMAKLLEGPATYSTMQDVMKLKPGPLYHHINQLRLTGLILPKQRDSYELTRAGRNLVLGLMALAPLTSDKRRRPS